MGILDDAIREHLELIRRRGATDSEVQRLEDEAFGPPTRPDEADFPQSDEALAASGNGVATEAGLEEPGPEDAAMHEDVTTLMPAEERDEIARPAEEPEPSEQGTAGAVDAEPESAEEALPVAEEEPAAEVHPVVEEPGPEPHDEPSDELSGPAEQGTTLYDQSQDELDIDLDLQVAESSEAAAPSEEALSEEVPLEEVPPEEVPPEEASSDEHDVAEPEGSTPLEPPIESLETVEHPFPDEITEPEEPHEEASPSDEHAVPEEAAPAAEPEKEDEGGEDEDVLADTPDFLKDAPEDDELWFEQGEPKDFDF
jgi:hypothetical protein